MTDLYLQTTKNLENFLTSLLSAQAPEKFTQKFLESLEFKSTNDRLFIKMLKDLGFLSASGEPTQRYYDYLDQSQSKVVLAQGIRSAYDELFKVKIDANTLSDSDIKGKLKSLTGGKKTDHIYSLMAKTFVALCALADFTTSPKTIQEHKNESTESAALSSLDPSGSELDHHEKNSQLGLNKPLSLHYNIQIILPDTRDQKVFDSIFASLKRHLG